MFIRMDENLKFALTLGAGALGGAIVAGLFAVIGAWIANKREHRQWLRNERLRAYETFFAEMRPWSSHRWHSPEIDFSKEAQAAAMQLAVVAPKAVIEASSKLEQQISDYRSVYREAVERAGESGVPTREFYETVMRHHVHTVDKLAAELGAAMRMSLRLPRAEAAQWITLLQNDAPTEEQYRQSILQGQN